MHARTYTNVVLTVIATLLLVLTLQRAPLSMDPATPAHAAGERNLPQQVSTDPPLAAATEKVAAANTEIARQIGEVARALNGMAGAIQQAGIKN